MGRPAGAAVPDEGVDGAGNAQCCGRRACAVVSRVRCAVVAAYCTDSTAAQRQTEAANCAFHSSLCSFAEANVALIACDSAEVRCV